MNICIAEYFQKAGMQLELLGPALFHSLWWPPGGGGGRGVGGGTVLEFSCRVHQYKYCSVIEEGFIQKARQTVVVSVWGARSNAALGMFGLHVRYC